MFVEFRMSFVFIITIGTYNGCRGDDKRDTVTERRKKREGMNSVSEMKLKDFCLYPLCVRR